MLQQCTQACKWAFLAVVLIIAAYLVLANEKTIKEKFVVGSFENVDADTAKYYDTIRTLIQTYLLRQPEQYELERYKKMMSNPKDVDTVISSIQKTTEYQELVKASPKSNSIASLTPFIQQITTGSTTRIDQVLSDASAKQRTEMYKTIIRIYDKHLERMPSMRELNYYTYRMLTDPKFDEKKLEAVILSSKEYEILQKNQNNVVHGELNGNITDAQLTMEVHNLYDMVFNDTPDAEMERFLKYKYRAYELNEKRFTEFLLLLKALEDHKVDIKSLADGTMNIQIQPVVADDVDGITNIVGVASDEASRPYAPGNASNSMSKNSQNSSSQYVYNNQRIYNIINPGQEELDQILKGNTGTTGSSQSCHQFKTYKDSLYENLKKEQTQELQKGYQQQSNIAEDRPCTMDKNAQESKLENSYRPRNKLAEYQSERNLDELATSCARNTYYLNADDDMVLYPEFKWQMPERRPPPCVGSCGEVQPMSEQTALIGTLLTDAENTKVGSMLPKFVYKETYTN
jgi:hypothetical protein